MAAIGKVAVIGAGVMGAGIAAHIANAGVPVALLDRVPDGAEDRNAIAAGASAGFYAPRERAPHHDRQYRGRPRSAGRGRLDRRGGDRGPRHQATGLRDHRSDAARGIDRFLQHLDGAFGGTS
jgi:glycine/D-amino acid oxidase-like deaminating enzyme